MSNTNNNFTVQEILNRCFDDSTGKLSTNLTSGAFNYKGVIACNTNPNYPAATQGDIYIVSVAGLIGGAGGLAVTAGDMLFCQTTTAAGDQATVGSKWDIVQANIDLTNVAITGGTMSGVSIDNSAIGGATKTTGKFTGVTADTISGADNATTLPISIAATGADIATHTISLSIDGDTGISVAATGDGAGHVGAKTIIIGQVGDTINVTPGIVLDNAATDGGTIYFNGGA